MKSRKPSRQSILAAVGVALLTAGLTGGVTGGALADGSGFSFKKLATIPGRAPGGGTFINDFEPYAINAGGNAAFVADLADANGNFIGEGVFVSRWGQPSAIALPGQAAPGGGKLDGGALGHTPLNNAGRGAFVYILDPGGASLGLNAGLYRFSLFDQKPTAVVVPGVTPAPVPAGAKFAGVYFNSSLNNRDDLVFNGVVPGLAGPPKANGFGVGVFKADRWNRIASVVVPGDKAPGGGVFDDAIEGWINDAGDTAFDAHVKGEECIDLGSGFELVCGSSVYKLPRNGKVRSIAHQGDPAPGPGGFTYRQAFGPVMNDTGDLVFAGDLTPPPGVSLAVGVFQHSKGKTTPVVLPGDPLPGGGKFATTASIPYQYYLNNAGDVTFVAALDTVDGDGVADTGLYMVSHGKTRLVARTGSDIPGIGTVAHVNSPAYVKSGPLQAGGIINDGGQIFFEVVLTNNKGVLLVATPRDGR
jgi:hypothetical protein